MRRFMLEAVRAMAEGGDPPGLAWTPEENQSRDYPYMITSVLLTGADWKACLPKV